jgi:hypothetical protein
MRQRLLLLLFVSCALCWMGTALVVCDADVPRLPLPPAAPVFQVVGVLPAPAEACAAAVKPFFAGEPLPAAAAPAPALPSADANGTPLATGRYFKAAYAAFHYSDRAG